MQHQSLQRWQRAGGQKPKEGEDVYNAEQVAKDTKISADNPLVCIISSLVSFSILSGMIRCYYECGFAFTLER